MPLVLPLSERRAPAWILSVSLFLVGCVGLVALGVIH